MNENYNSKNPSLDAPSVNQKTSYFASGDGKSESLGMTNSQNQQKEPGKTGWQMPEPVFRVSDGYCPLKSDRSASASSKKQQNTDSKTANQSAEENLPDITLFNVDLSELKSAESENSSLQVQGASEQPSAANAKSEILAENKSKNKIIYVVLTLVGIFVMLFLAAAIVGVAYFWFYYRTSAG
ncbi:MAG TPA: hypothetical protein VF556_08075 [Pyrinomonadaceae bacterium]|jgi:hypothetical protein